MNSRVVNSNNIATPSLYGNETILLYFVSFLYLYGKREMERCAFFHTENSASHNFLFHYLCCVPLLSIPILRFQIEGKVQKEKEKERNREEDNSDMMLEGFSLQYFKFSTLK